MAAQQFYLPFPTAFSSNGLPAAGAKLYFYYTGGTTPAPTYSNLALTTENANPIVANGAARFDSIYLDDTITYRLVIKDSNDVSLGVDQDPYIPGVSTPVISIGTTSEVSTIALIEAISSPSDLDTVHLTDPARSGKFIFSNADLSAEVTADPAQAVYVAPTSDATGASGAWVRQYDVLSVKYYGATGDGATDDSAAIQAGLDAVIAAGGGSLYFPESTYVCDSALDFPATGVTLYGDGTEATILDFSSLSTPGDVCVDFTNGNRCSIRDLTIQGAASVTDGIRFGNVSAASANTFVRVKFIDHRYGTYGLAGVNNTFTDCEWRGCDRPVYQTAQSNNWVFIRPYFLQNYGWAYIVNSSATFIAPSFQRIIPNITVDGTVTYTNAGTTATTTITTTGDFVADGVTVGMFVAGTGVAASAKVATVSASTITVDFANTATVSGDLEFYAEEYGLYVQSSEVDVYGGYWEKKSKAVKMALAFDNSAVGVASNLSTSLAINGGHITPDGNSIITYIGQPKIKVENCNNCIDPTDDPVNGLSITRQNSQKYGLIDPVFSPSATLAGVKDKKLIASYTYGDTPNSGVLRIERGYAVTRGTSALLTATTVKGQYYTAVYLTQFPAEDNTTDRLFMDQKLSGVSQDKRETLNIPLKSEGFRPVYIPFMARGDSVVFSATGSTEVHNVKSIHVYEGTFFPPMDVTIPRQQLWTAAPTAGTWVKGDFVLNSAAASGGIYGWYCTTAGTPGTWVPVGIAGAIQSASVAALAQTISATYSQSEVQAISSKVDAFIAAQKTAKLMAT